jgi:hypothetical protein
MSSISFANEGFLAWAHPLKPAEEMNSGYTEVTKDFKQPGAESR